MRGELADYFLDREIVDGNFASLQSTLSEVRVFVVIDSVVFVLLLVLVALYSGLRFQWARQKRLVRGTLTARGGIQNV